MSDVPPPVDPRLLDAVAMCLCWAEFGKGLSFRPPGETPAIYWAKMDAWAHGKYYADATPIARFMMGDKSVALVSAAASQRVCEALVQSWGRASGADLGQKRWASALSRIPRFPKDQP